MMFNKDPEVMRLAKQHSLNSTAAIMFADIVGYTTLIENDQQAALELLDSNRNLHKFYIEQHGGTWTKEMGDGILASFESASTAVECALNIQRACNNVPGLKLRIGIHLGEVVFTQNDVFGIVVNIASRLQCLAKPGQILVSGSIANRISLESSYRVNLIGNRRLKNVQQAVQVHRIGEANELEQFTWWSVYTQCPIH